MSKCLASAKQTTARSMAGLPVICQCSAALYYLVNLDASKMTQM